MERSVGLPGFRDFILILGNVNFRSVFGENSCETFTRTKSIHKSSRFGNPRGLIGHFNLYYSYYRGYEHAPAQKWIVYPWKNKFLP